MNPLSRVSFQLAFLLTGLRQSPTSTFTLAFLRGGGSSRGFTFTSHHHQQAAAAARALTSSLLSSTTTTTTSTRSLMSSSILLKSTATSTNEGEERGGNEPLPTLPTKKRGRPPAAAAAATATAAAAVGASEEKKKVTRKATTTATRKKKAEKEEEGGEGGEGEVPAVSTTTKKRATKTKTTKAAAVTSEDTPDITPLAPTPKKRTRKAAATTTTTVATTAAAAASASSTTTTTTTKTKPTTSTRATIPRSPTPRLDGPSSSSSFTHDRPLLRLLSWNVAGLRGLMKKEASLTTFRTMLENERPDIVCLQETKLQEAHVEEVSAALKELHLPRYEGQWFCSTAKKGYSGTCVLVSEECAVRVVGGEEGVKCGIGVQDGDLEGRVITLDFGSFYLVNVYTPNSGEGLKRLAFRTTTWDRAFEKHLLTLQEGGRKGVVCVGDLNVAHLDKDFFNPHEPRMKKAAGTTPEERDSFTHLLSNAQMIDTFRNFHPEVEGVYSYFSMRAGNRPFNRGMRLDYVLASSNMMSVGGSGEGKSEKEGGGGKGKGKGKGDGGGGGAMPVVLDSFILDEEEEYMKMSDHAPVGALLAV